MQWVIHSLLVLAICEPLFLDAKKVIILRPRYVRRSQSPPWSQFRHLKKHGFPNSGFPGQEYGFSHRPKLYHPKQLQVAKDQYPQGGDAFDQGHENVNHVMVPHGKGMSFPHAVSFGKGYIPFESYKDPRLSASHHHNSEAKYPSDQNMPSGPGINYPSGPNYSQALLSQQASLYVGNERNSDQDRLQDRVHDRTVQNFAPGKFSYDTTITPNIGSHFGTERLATNPSGNVFTPGAIPSTPIDGSKTEIVLRDSIAFDDYNRKVAELTKNWPVNFGSGNHLVPGSLGNTRLGTVQQGHDFSRQFDGSGVSGGSNLTPNLGQNQQGYEVKEEVVDTPPDFRKMPVQNAPVQSYQPHQQQIQFIHQPVQQAVQHIYSQPQGVPVIPVNYGNYNNYQGHLHG